MPDVPMPEAFWLLTGNAPSGPFTVAQIHDLLATGAATWHTRACRVGASHWHPLAETPGIGPAEPAPALIAPVGSPTGPTAAQPLSPPRPSVRPEPPPVPTAGSSRRPHDETRRAQRADALIGTAVFVFAVAVVVVAGYGLYELFRPLTATEVCRKMETARTAVDAKPYATPRMYPFIESSFADDTGTDPNNVFHWTQETDGPQPSTKLVGFRGSFFLPEAGHRVHMEGHCRVIRADGWKVDDMIVTGVEGAALPGPVSLVDEYRRNLAPPQPGPVRPAPTKPPPQRSGTPNPPPASALTRTFVALREAIGWGGIVVLAILLAAGATVRESWRKNSPRA